MPGAPIADPQENCYTWICVYAVCAALTLLCLLIRGQFKACRDSQTAKHALASVLRIDHSFENFISCNNNGNFHQELHSREPWVQHYRNNFWFIANASSLSILGKGSVLMKGLFYGCISGLICSYSIERAIATDDFLFIIYFVNANTLAQALSFLTMLLFTTYLFKELNRWEAIQLGYHGCQGPLHNLSLLFGNLKNDQDRKIAYRLWRYLSLMHIHLFKGLDPQYDFDLDTLERASLVHGERERAALRLTGDVSREAITGWIVQLADHCCENGHLPVWLQPHVAENLTLLRARMGGFRDTMDLLAPISLVVVMRILLEVQIVLFVLGFAGVFAESRHKSALMTRNELACPDSWNAAVASGVVTLVFTSLNHLTGYMINPWGSGFNRINAEAEIFLTERVTMHNLNQGHLDMASELSNTEANREKDAEAYRERHGSSSRSCSIGDSDVRNVSLSLAWEPTAGAGGRGGGTGAGDGGSGVGVEMLGRGSGGGGRSDAQ